MTYASAIQALTHGRAAKPTQWGGYVKRTDRPEAFSTSQAYAVGDLVAYDGKAYVCKATHSAGAWNSAHFDELYAIPVDFSADATYAVGAQVVQAGSVWQCISAIATPAAWDATKWTRLVDRPHALTFQERSDADDDSHLRYIMKCTVSPSGRTYGELAPALSLDSALFAAQVWDDSWTLGDAAAFELARSGSSRW